MAYQKGMANIWVVLITIVVMGGLAGGGYYYLSSKHTKAMKVLSDRKALLEGELSYLKKSSSSTSATSSSPCATSSSSLQVYTNSKYGYCFEYPKNYGLIDYLYDSQTGTRVEQYRTVMVDEEAIPENAVKYQSEYPAAWMAIGANDEKFTAEMVAGYAEGDTVQEITIDGHPAWKIVGSTASILDETYSTHIYTNSDGYGISIWWTNSDAAGTHDSQIDTIVASIRWL